MKIKTRKITITAILSAICLILGLTPIGYIPIPPVTMTLMCIPVIIGTVLEGFGSGLVLGLVFGITSLCQAIGFTLVPNAFGMWMINSFPLQAIITIFIPRLLIPVIVWLVYNALSNDSQKGLRQKINTGITAFLGSLSNTVFFLGFLYVLMLPNAEALAPNLGTTVEGLFAAIAYIGMINGLPEAALAVILCIPIIAAVKRSRSNFCT